MSAALNLHAPTPWLLRPIAAATVSLPSLNLSALQAAVAAAVSSGATTLEAAAVVTEASTVGVQAVWDLNSTAPVILAGPDGVVRSVIDDRTVL